MKRANRQVEASPIVSLGNATSPRDNSTAIDLLYRSRRVVAALGIVSLLILGLFLNTDLAPRLAIATLAALGVATLLALPEALRAASQLPPARRVMSLASGWLPAAIVVAGSTVAAQTWFRAGTAIAGGDLALPDGTGWISRLFATWSWSGSNLGGPSLLEPQLPWALILRTVEWWGGSAELAQRIWFTALFAGAGLAAYALLRVLRMSQTASVIGAFAYLFSPHIVANVGTNPIYFAAMALLAALPAVILAVAAGSIRIRTGALLFGIAAPILGYVYQNPPLVGMVIGAVLITPALARWVGGVRAFRRAGLVLGLGCLLLTALSAYWLAPAAVQLNGVPSAQLATTSSWSWTEARATIQNSLWLNTAWGWTYPEYYPYAVLYGRFPLSIVRFLPAVLAFGSLLVITRPGRRGHLGEYGYHLRLAIASASSAWLLIFISTGTNSPGNLLFDRLYALPFGWLLREPGRFLMAAALAYALLISLSVDAICENLPRWRLLAVPTVSRLVQTFAAAGTIALLLVPGFPLFTGAIVPDQRPILPSAHVHLPSYWTDMTQFVNSIRGSSPMLVLPPDDFYQMPYKWGYYGTDYFIANLMMRPTLVPSAEGYTPATRELIDAVNLTAQSALAHNWSETQRLLNTLGTPLILVRADIATSFPNRRLVSADALSKALRHAPNFSLLHRSGPLELFELSVGSWERLSAITNYVTISENTPDLRVLSVLPDRARLVTGPPEEGVPSIVESPPVERWLQQGSELSWNLPEPEGRIYQLSRLDASASPHPSTKLASTTGGSDVNSVRTATRPGDAGRFVHLSLEGRDTLTDGGFEKGLWAPVGDCDDVLGPAGMSYIEADVRRGGPKGLRYLHLAATADSACESQGLGWTGGPLLISLNVRHEYGNAPRLCLWEVGPDQCASLSELPVTATWMTYRATWTPEPNTRGLALFLYADSSAIGQRTVNDYSDIQALELQALPAFVLLGTPGHTNDMPAPVMIQRTSYSEDWGAHPVARQVLVDGLLNGWVLDRSALAVSVHYGPADAINDAFLLSGLTAAAVFGIFLALIASHWRRRLRGHADPSARTSR